eukprot:COSAG01_NODE_782_length_13631_cov_73.763450_4_plen_57_part_00
MPRRRYRRAAAPQRRAVALDARGGAVAVGVVVPAGGRRPASQRSCAVACRAGNGRA